MITHASLDVNISITYFYIADPTCHECEIKRVIYVKFYNEQAQLFLKFVAEEKKTSHLGVINYFFNEIYFVKLVQVYIGVFVSVNPEAIFFWGHYKVYLIMI